MKKVCLIMKKVSHPFNLILCKKICFKMRWRVTPVFGAKLRDTSGTVKSNLTLFLFKGNIEIFSRSWSKYLLFLTKNYNFYRWQVFKNIEVTSFYSPLLLKGEKRYFPFLCLVTFGEGKRHRRCLPPQKARESVGHLGVDYKFTSGIA